MRLCDICGKPLQGGYGRDGAIVCRDCEPVLNAEIEKLREQGKPVNALHIARRIYRETYSGGDYLLRDVPANLMTRAKHRAIDDGCSVRTMLIRALTEYVERNSKEGE